MIFAGDLFQYPPVGGSPLYAPIRSYAGQTNDEIQKRLGRLAWKSINAVINFTEQNRMKDDVEYGDAVARLRKRKCTDADVELFNTRIIKNFVNPNGIDMGLDINYDACAIVVTNSLREALNEKKTEASCSRSQLMNCYALDKCSNRVLTLEDRQRLIQLDANGMGSSKSLPGSITFYVGMPVILRTRNLSTDLGITNGSQGIVRRIFTAECPLGLKYGVCVIVEFPYSKVDLSQHRWHLPPKHFPVTPITWTFTTLLKDSDNPGQKLRITRSQLPIQPAFAVTGHSAQGKTLPKVLVNLAEGGFAAYVAASRATSRQGLCITEPVTIQNLNKPLPHDLLEEVRRLEAIEHNTLITYGVQSGPPIPVPDAESECSSTHVSHRVQWIQEERNKQKRKRENNFKIPNDGGVIDIDGEATDLVTASPQSTKRIKLVHQQSCPSDLQSLSSQAYSQACTQLPDAPIGAGCQWSSTNWSCSYDSVFMVLFHMYHLANRVCRKAWVVTSNKFMDLLTLLFDRLLENESNLISSSLFNACRDEFRDMLSMHDPHNFPRFGAVGASVSCILELICPPSKLVAVTACSNNACHTLSQPQQLASNSLATICFSLKDGHIGNPTTLTLQDWLNDWIKNRLGRVKTIASEHDSPGCKGSMSTSLRLSAAPSALWFEIIESDTQVKPSPKLTIPVESGLATYSLSGIIYQGGFHFSARIVQNDPLITYTYDGQCNNGFPTPEHPPSDFETNLSSLDGRRAHIVLYSLLFHHT